MKRILILLAFLPLLALADANSTKSQYSAADLGLVKPSVILTSEDGLITHPINAANPLPVTGTITATPAGTQNVQGVAGGTPQPTTSGAPLAANILVGFGLSNGANLIAVPANRVFVGNIFLTAAVLVAPASATPINGSMSVATTGTNAVPAVGSVVAALVLSAPGSAASGVGTAANGSIGPIPVVIYGGASGAGLQLAVANMSVSQAFVIGALQ